MFREYPVVINSKGQYVVYIEENTEKDVPQTTPLCATPHPESEPVKELDTGIAEFEIADAQARYGRVARSL